MDTIHIYLLHVKLIFLIFIFQTNIFAIRHHCLRWYSELGMTHVSTIQNLSTGLCAFTTQSVIDRMSLTPFWREAQYFFLFLKGSTS